MKLSNLRLFYVLVILFFGSCCGSASLLRTTVPVIPSGARRDSAWLMLPKSYNCNSAKTTKFPLLIFFHGGGGASGVGTHNLDQMVNDASGTPPTLIQDKVNKNKMSFNVNGVNEQFIVLCPQHATGWRAALEVKVMIDSMIVKYRVDPNRVYLTGFSMGGYVVYNYLSQSAAYAGRIAAAVPMSAWGIDHAADIHPSIIANANVAVWGLCGSSDTHFDVNGEFVTAINAVHPGLAKFNAYPGGHCCWNIGYDTSHATYNPNIYEWLLTHHR